MTIKNDLAKTTYLWNKKNTQNTTTKNHHSVPCRLFIFFLSFRHRKKMTFFHTLTLYKKKWGFFRSAISFFAFSFPSQMFISHQLFNLSLYLFSAHTIISAVTSVTTASCFGKSFSKPSAAGEKDKSSVDGTTKGVFIASTSYGLPYSPCDATV